MSEYGSEKSLDDPVEADGAPAGDHVAGAAPVSEETGTVYEPTGEPASTPEDEERWSAETDG